MTTLSRCGWPDDHTSRPHCDGEGTYTDTWDGRLVHIIRTGHRPVPARPRPVQHIPAQGHDEQVAERLITLAGEIGYEEAADALGLSRATASRLWDLGMERW